MIRSEHITNLSAAICSLQARLPLIPRAQTVEITPRGGGRPYSYSYADLTDIWTAVRPLLAEQGLSLLQMPTYNPDGGLMLESLLLHSSGEYIGSTYGVSLSDTSPQAIGSAITYLRRYAVGAMLGLVTDDDDDGRAGGSSSRIAEQEATLREAEIRFYVYISVLTGLQFYNWDQVRAYTQENWITPRTVAEFRGYATAVRAHTHAIRAAQEAEQAAAAEEQERNRLLHDEVDQVESQQGLPIEEPPRRNGARGVAN